MYMYVYTCNYYNNYVYTEAYTHVHTTVFLIITYRAFHLAMHSSLFGPDGTVNYDYTVTSSINCVYEQTGQCLRSIVDTIYSVLCIQYSV